MFCNAFDLIETARGPGGNLYRICGKLSVILFNSRNLCIHAQLSPQLSRRQPRRRSKHTVQSLIIESLKKNRFSIWTSRRRGPYQLSGEHAERTGEYGRHFRIWQQDDLPAEMEAYISVIQHFSRSGQLRYYRRFSADRSPAAARAGQLVHDRTAPERFSAAAFGISKDARARVEKPMATCS